MSANLLQVQGAYKAFGPRILFEDAAFAINQGEHVGVIGPNGAGKTTLFKILLQEDHFDRGELVLARGTRLGYLAQHDDWDIDETVECYVSKHSLKALWELKALGRGLGLSDLQFASRMGALSGGYRMRAKLLALLGQEPDLMMLDEPTNYLDLDSLLVLENFLQDFKGAFLLISHDREFLRRTTDHILEVESAEITKFNGNLDDYFEQKTMLREQLESRALSLAQKRKEILDFVARFGAKATKARQAQSRLKSLNRMESIEVKSLPLKARIKIPDPVHCGKEVLRLRSVDLGYGSKIVLRDIHFEVKNGDHLAVVGVNGAGKTTFLKALAGDLKPLKGELELGYQVTLGYYAQHVSESLSASATVLEAMGEWAHPNVSTQEVKDMAGSLLFSGDDVLKRVSVLSGGERSRVALGRILLKRAPLLILDEPTNHLDFQTVESLTESLVRYPGTLIIVSHDRSFVRRIGSKVLEVHDGRADLFLGTYDDYVWSLQKGVLAKRQDDSSASVADFSSREKVDARVENSRSTSSSFEQRKEWQRELHRLQKESETCERALAQFEKSMSETSKALETATSLAESRLSVDQLADLAQKKAASEERWMEIIDRIETLKTFLSLE